MGMLLTRDLDLVWLMGNIGKSTISWSSTKTSKRQRSSDASTNGRVVDDILGDEDMENMFSSKSCHQDLFENEMRMRVEALSKKVDGMKKRMITIDEQQEAP